MKRIVLLIGFIAVIALCAQAQNYIINFSDMHPVSVPTPMPDYLNMSWDNFLYVTPGLWSGAGAGFWIDPSSRHNTVAFIGGSYCNVAATCSGSIKLGVGPKTPATFQPVSISISAGWLPNNVVVTAYNDGKFVGSTEWKLTTTPALYKFPPTWVHITQVVFTPKPFLGVTKQPPSMVVYSLLLTKH